MHVLLINGSPHKDGCTFTALSEIAQQLEKRGIDSEIFWIGKGPIRGCIDCRSCWGKGQCVFNDDCVNTLIEKIQAADGVVVGSPVYFAGIAGSLKCVLDRVLRCKASLLLQARRSGRNLPQRRRQHGI